MTTPMIFALGSWLEEKSVELGLPVILMDDLQPTGESMSLIQTASPITEKEYINGSRQCRIDVDIVAQGSVESRRNLIEYLTTLVYMFENLKDYTLDDEHRILRCSSTAPSIRMRTENDMLRYAISVSITYKEN